MSRCSQIMICIILFAHQVSALDRAILPINQFVQSLWIENNATTTSTLWISGPVVTAGLPRETSFEFLAGERTRLSLGAFSEQPWILIKTNQGDKLKVSVTTTKLKVLELPWGMSNHYIDSIAPTETPLYLTNPNPFPVSGQLHLGIKRIPFKVDAEAVLKLAPVTPTLVDVKIESDHRIAALWMGETVLRRPAIAESALPFELRTGIYFLMENSSQDQSFVVELTDEKLSAQARLQIQKPNLGMPRILIAEAQMKHNAINRDWHHPAKAPWNWSVSQVFRFADFAIQECDGSPEFLDEILPYWLANGGLICFWNYRVRRELTAEQVARGKD